MMPTFSVVAIHGFVVGGYIFWTYRDKNGAYHSGRATSFDDAVIGAGIYGFKLDRGGK